MVQSWIIKLESGDDHKIQSWKHYIVIWMYTYTESYQKRKTAMGWPCLEEQNPMPRAMIKQNPLGKRHLGRPRMRRENVIKKDAEQFGGSSDWRNLALDREG